MEPTPELIVELDPGEIEQAKRMTFARRFAAGAELFDDACSITRAGIKFQNPGFSEERVLAGLGRRVAMDDRIEKRWSEAQALP